MLYACIFQSITASPVTTKGSDINLDKRFVGNKCVPTATVACLQRRGVALENEKESILVKRVHTSADCPKGGRCIHRRDVIDEKNAEVSMVKRGHHHHRWNKHGFGRWFGGWRHRGGYW